MTELKDVTTTEVSVEKLAERNKKIAAETAEREKVQKDAKKEAKKASKAGKHAHDDDGGDAKPKKSKKVCWPTPNVANTVYLTVLS